MKINLAELFHYQTQKQCVFCHPSEELILKQTDNFTLLFDPFALLPGHLLITSKGHYGCLGEVPSALIDECTSLREEAKEMLRTHYGAEITRYEHGRAGHCIARAKETRSCHHYHEHLLPANLSLHLDYKKIHFIDEKEVPQLFERFGEYLLVEGASGIKTFYRAEGETVAPHLLRTLAAEELGHPERHDWEAYSDCKMLLEGKRTLLSVEACETA